MKEKGVAIALMISALSGAWARDDYPGYAMLASVDAGRVLDLSSDEVMRARKAFERANALCEAPNGLANQVTIIRKGLQSKRIATSNVEILEGLAGVLYGARKKPDCASILAMYATVRTSDMPEMQTHTDAALGLRALARAGAFGFAVDESPPKFKVPK